MDAAVGLDVLCDPFGADAVVNGDAIGACCFGKSDISVTCFSWEGDDGDTWVALFQGLGDFSRRLQRIIYKIIPLQRSRPAVKEFDNLGAGLNLFAEVFDGCIR